jgi:hypothetical protein
MRVAAGRYALCDRRRLVSNNTTALKRLGNRDFRVGARHERCRAA